MDTTQNQATNHDLEHQQTSFYTPLPDQPSVAGDQAILWRPSKGFAVIFASVIFLLSLGALIVNNQSQEQLPTPNKDSSSSSSQKTKSFSRPEPRGVAQGVSAKSNLAVLDLEVVSYNWTNAMISWQRTAFHFQPERNWMNDPNGPLFHMGWYHLFYQYNPDSAIWGNITWGHAISRDLIHWLYLPIAMVPDQWYDINGVWTGSATILPDGRIVMLYTGDTDDYVQVQNLAYPANLSDPFLLDWVKYSGNPVLVPPPGIGKKDFRDPTTAWVGPEGKWRFTLGTRVNTMGLSLVYETTNFTSFELMEGVLHAVPGTGMWECVDFYPVATNGSVGLDTSADGPGIKHVLKASLDESKEDVYAVGTYDPIKGTWTPDNLEQDVGIGLRVDYGRYYASKSFFDQYKMRRILWGWITETDTESDDLEKGWASLQAIPRTVLFDNKTGTNVLQWPVEEVESLRLDSRVFDGVVVGPGSVVSLDIGTATQLDIIAEFEIESIGSNTTDDDVNGDDSCGGGAVDRSTLGPFGILVIADETLSELTPVFFRPTNTVTYFCADETRSSKASGVFKRVYGSTVPILDDEKLSMRVLVDHSIVESFAQGGRTVITTRIYATEAIYGAARLFLFNNATRVNVKATLTVWQLNSAFIHPFSSE